MIKIVRLKSFEEIFPEIDIKEFEVLQLLKSNTYNIFININNATYSTLYANKEFEIDCDDEDIKDEKLYKCIFYKEGYELNYILVYGSWIEIVENKLNLLYKDSLDILREMDRNEKNKDGL